MGTLSEEAHSANNFLNLYGVRYKESWQIIMLCSLQQLLIIWPEKLWRFKLIKSCYDRRAFSRASLARQ